MKKNIFSLLFIFTWVINNAFCQDLTIGTWVIESNKVMIGTDTGYLFNRNQVLNQFDLSKNSYKFNSSGLYIGTKSDSTIINGFWILDSDSLFIDGNGGKFFAQSQTSFYTLTEFNTINANGDIINGYSQINFINNNITDIKELQVDYYKGNIYFDRLNKNLKFNDFEFSFSLRLYNQIGQLLLQRKISERDTEVDCSNFGNSILFVHLLSENKYYIKKIVTN